jgi:flagellar protein FliO/FliZ
MISQGLTSLLWFLAILALIPIALWLLKRTPMGGASSQGVLRSIAALPLSASQRIVTVEVGHGPSRRWLVLGVTPQSITTLHAMEPLAEPPPAATPPAPGFAALLDRLRPRSAGTDER